MYIIHSMTIKHHAPPSRERKFIYVLWNTKKSRDEACLVSTFCFLDEILL